MCIRDRYKIKTAADLAPYTTVTNRASIYFDDNDPIITNTTSNINTPLHIKVNTPTPVFKIYPNPTTAKVSIESSETGEFMLYDLLGKEVYRSTISNPNTILFLPSLSNGLYFYQFLSNRSNKTIGKLIIESK